MPQSTSGPNALDPNEIVREPKDESYNPGHKQALDISDKNETPQPEALETKGEGRQDNQK